MIVYLNGELVDEDRAAVSLFDGGYLYGDGVFETVRLYGGVPFDLDGHLARMRGQLEILDYAWRPDVAELAGIIARLVTANGRTGRDSRCRITVSRGRRPGTALPLSGHRDLTPTLSVFLQPVDPTLADDQRDGIGVKVMSAGFARGNFPHLKSLNYLTTITALRAARAEGCREALLLDGDGRVLEAATSNVFLIDGGELATPPLRLGLLEGRTRALLLDLARREGLVCREQAFTAARLQGVDEVFVCGSVKEVVPVVVIDGKRVGDGRPGPLTQRLQAVYHAAALAACAAAGDVGGADGGA